MYTHTQHTHTYTHTQHTHTYTHLRTVVVQTCKKKKHTHTQHTHTYTHLRTAVVQTCLNLTTLLLYASAAPGDAGVAAGD